MKPEFCRESPPTLSTSLPRLCADARAECRCISSDRSDSLPGLVRLIALPCPSAPRPLAAAPERWLARRTAALKLIEPIPWTKTGSEPLLPAGAPPVPWATTAGEAWGVREAASIGLSMDLSQRRVTVCGVGELKRESLETKRLEDPELSHCLGEKDAARLGGAPCAAGLPHHAN
jgi:hypothetical protein